MAVFKIREKKNKNVWSKINRHAILLFIVLSFVNHSFSQVGINNITPKATLHVSSDLTTIDTPDGIIAPILTKQQLIDKSDIYTTEQKGAILYVTNTNELSDATTEKVTHEGYYYFDGNQWIPFSEGNNSFYPNQETAWRIQGSNEKPTSVDDNIYQNGNVAIGTNIANSADVKLYVSGKQFVDEFVKVGGDSDQYTASAQLELADDDKGILINKVMLLGKYVKEPVVDVVEGLLVYNINTIASEGISPGFYYWDGTCWLMINKRFPQPAESSIKNLQVDCLSYPGNANDSDKGTVMDFGEITIGEEGAYAFTFRLYGTVGGSPPAGKAGFYYLALMIDDEIVDSVELDLVFPIQNSASSPIVLSATTTLMGIIKAGQKVEFKLTHHKTASPYQWTLKALPTAGAKSANRTSMLWWKL